MCLASRVRYGMYIITNSKYDKITEMILFGYRQTVSTAQQYESYIMNDRPLSHLVVLHMSEQEYIWFQAICGSDEVLSHINRQDRYNWYTDDFFICFSKHTCFSANWWNERIYIGLDLCYMSHTSSICLEYQCDQETLLRPKSLYTINNQLYGSMTFRF